MSDAIKKETWDGFYKVNKLSEVKWETNVPDHSLVSYLNANELPGTALDIGCGIGTNALYMAQQGIQVTAFDIATRPINLARAQAKYRSRFL